MKIKAISHISHDGEMIEPGKTASVSDDVGKHLVESGSAMEVKMETSKVETKTSKDENPKSKGKGK